MPEQEEYATSYNRNGRTEDRVKHHVPSVIRDTSLYGI